MKKVLTLGAIMLFTAVGTFSQEKNAETVPMSDLGQITKLDNSKKENRTNTKKHVQSSSDYKKYEVFLGYSFANSKFKEYKRDTRLQAIQGLDKNTFNKRKYFKYGYEAAAVYNFSRYAGVKGSFSMNLNKRKGKINNKEFVVKERLTNYLGGIQFKDNSKDAGAFRPFAHVLAGASNARSKIKDCSGFGTPCPSSLNKSRYGYTVGVGVGLDIRINDKVMLRLIQVDYKRGKVSEGITFSAGIVF